MTINIEDLVRAIVREELARVSASPDMVAHDAWEAPPPGEDDLARARRLRRWSERARRGDIPGAVRRGRRWYASRESLATYFAKTEKTSDVEAEADDITRAALEAVSRRRGRR